MRKHIRKFLVIFVLMFIWLRAGYYAHGYALGHLTQRFPSMCHEPAARNFSFLGPAALAVLWFTGSTSHWKDKPLTLEERWEHYKKRWPTLAKAGPEDAFAFENWRCGE